MAEKKDITAEAEVKTPAVEVKKEVSTAPVTDKPDEVETSDAPDEKDISEVIKLLNEIQTMNGGKGDIAEIAPNLVGTVKFLLDKMIALRDAFQDPLFKSVLDDMVDQQEDGKTPSLLVAVARNAPMEELQDLANNENYADVQGAVDEQLASAQANADAEEAMFANFEESQKEGQAYADKMGYDEAEASELFKTAMDWFSILGDGKITEKEWGDIDNMRNYARDTEELRNQIPEAPEKEIMPDTATIAETMKEKPKETKAKPANSLERLGAASPSIGKFEDVGKKRYRKG
jgi:hypothetical protein